MASEVNMPINGGYGPPPPYNAAELPANNPPPGPNGTTTNTAAASSVSDTSDVQPSKDEVGWFFVEEFYKVWTQTPEKIHVSPLAQHAACD